MKKFRSVVIELGTSRIQGIGVFAARPLLANSKVAAGIHATDYKDLIPWWTLAEHDEDVLRKINDFCIGTPGGFLPPPELDFNILTIEWYFNHSCDGNVGFNEKGDFVTRRDTAKGEELSYDYGLAESNPNFKMECKCGGARCRRIITGNDWKDPTFRAKNLRYMLPRLRRVTERADAHGA